MNWFRLKRRKALAKSFGNRPNSALLEEIADKAARHLVLERDGYTCTLCGSRKDVQWCHLISRARKLVRHDPENATTLCVSCHARYTRDQEGAWVKLCAELMGERWEKLRARAWALRVKPDYQAWIIALGAIVPSLAPRPWPSWHQRRPHERFALAEREKPMEEDRPALTEADAEADLAGTPRPDHPTQPPTRGIAMAIAGPLAVVQRAPILRSEPNGDVYKACMELAAYTPVVGDQGTRYNELAAALADFLFIIISTTHPGPERSTAISRAQEAKFWAAQAISRERQNGQDAGLEEGPAIMDAGARKPPIP